MKMSLRDMFTTQNEKLTNATELLDSTSINISDKMQKMKTQMAQDMKEIRAAIKILTDHTMKPSKWLKTSTFLTQESPPEDDQSMPIEDITAHQLL